MPPQKGMTLGVDFKESVPQKGITVGFAGDAVIVRTKCVEVVLSAGSFP